MPTKKKTTKKTTKRTSSKKDDHSRKDSHNVIVNVGTTARTTTRKKGVQTFSKGNSYLGGTAMRAMNYPSTTVINNMPPTPMMFPQMETNRISAIENGMNNLYADIQGLYGKLNAPTQEDVKTVIPQLTDPFTKSIVESKASIKANNPTVDMASASSSSTSTPTFGGSTSSDDSSGGGGDLQVPSQTMHDASDAFETPKEMSMSVPTVVRDIPEFNNESVGSFDSPKSFTEDLFSQTPVVEQPTNPITQQSRNQADTTIDVNPSANTTIDVNPSSKGKSIKVKPEVKDEIKTEPISPPSSKGSSKSVNQPKKPTKKEQKEQHMKGMQMRYEEIMDSINYLQTKDVVTPPKDKEKTVKGYHDELSDMYFKLHPKSKKEPNDITKLSKAVNKKLYVDRK